MRRSSRYPLHGLEKLALTREEILRPVVAVDVWAQDAQEVCGQTTAIEPEGCAQDLCVQDVAGEQESAEMGEGHEENRAAPQIGRLAEYREELMEGVPASEAVSGELLTDMAEFSALVRASDVVLLDVETTQLSPASPPLKLPRGVVGDATPRLRVVTVGIPQDDGDDLRIEVFDIQRYSPEDVAGLLDAVLRAPIVVGHNITFDLNWTRYAWRQLHPGAEFPPAPTVGCDTMLLSRLLAPETGEEVGGFALADILVESAEAGAERMNKQYQNPRNWMPDALEPGALSYARADVDALWTWLDRRLPGEGGVRKRLNDFVAQPTQVLWENLQDWYVSEEFPNLGEILDAWWALPEMLSDWFLRGQPYSLEAVAEYRALRESQLADAAREMVALEPELEPFAPVLADSGKGFPAPLKSAIGEAFTRRGVTLSRTEKTNAYQIGVKDLRGAQVTQRPESLALFIPYKKICDIKRRVEMASTYADFARLDGRIHPIFSPLTKTCRLACGEPNMQQVPGDKEFRAFIRGSDGTLISACDVSALDVRVGAALAVRLQRNLRQSLTGKPISSASEQVTELLRRNWVASEETQTFQQWLESPGQRFRVDKLRDLWVSASRMARSNRQPVSFREILAETKRLEDIAGQRDGGLPDGYWRDLDALHEHTLANTMWRLRTQAAKAESATYSALRDAFTLGVDIHSWTGAKLANVDAEALFANARTPEEIHACNEELKERIGSMRKLGKVSNLGLMYAMGSDGFLHYCKSNWDLHFLEAGEESLPPAEQYGLALSRARELRLQWLDAYPEIQLMILATAFQGRVYDKRDNVRRKNGKQYAAPGARWLTHTLAGRPIVAGSRFAALNYPNQGTGSDILLGAAAWLRQRHPETYRTIINQVHDEIVLEAPGTSMPEHAARLEEAITLVGSRLLSPFGVPMKAETVIGGEWQKG
jgi:hypothetical protein